MVTRGLWAGLGIWSHHSFLILKKERERSIGLSSHTNDHSRQFLPGVRDHVDRFWMSHPNPAKQVLLPTPFTDEQTEAQRGEVPANRQKSRVKLQHSAAQNGGPQLTSPSSVGTSPREVGETQAAENSGLSHQNPLHRAEESKVPGRGWGRPEKLRKPRRNGLLHSPWVSQEPWRVSSEREGPHITSG